MQRYFIEALGTFFLVLVMAFTGNPLAIGLILSALTYLGGHVSGGHYNPAVSLAFFLNGKIAVNDMIMYMGAQTTGAFAASSFYWVLSKTAFIPSPGKGLLLWEAIGLEALFAFVFCSVFLVLALSTRYKGGSEHGLVLGLTLSAVVFAIGNLSGGVINPAISVGSGLFASLMGVPIDAWRSVILYIIGPSIGGIVAGYFYQHTLKR